MLALVLAALATGRAGWLPRALVLVSAVGALAFAATNPDGRIASRNVDRYLAGREDRRVLPVARSAPDAAVAAHPAAATRSACVGAIRADLARDDGLLGANVARARARARARAASRAAPARGCAYD